MGVVATVVVLVRMGGSVQGEKKMQMPRSVITSLPKIHCSSAMLSTAKSKLSLWFSVVDAILNKVFE